MDRDRGQTFGLERRGSIGRGDGGSRENLSNTLQIAGFPVIDTSRRKTGRGTPPAAANALPARDPNASRGRKTVSGRGEARKRATDRVLLAVPGAKS